MYDKDNLNLFHNRDFFEYPLIDLIRNGATQLIVLAVKAEVNELLAKFDEQHTETGLQVGVQK